MNKKIIMGVLLLGILGGIGAYYYTFHKPHKDTFSLKADFSLKAESLFSEFESDEEHSNSKYLGKLIEVEGIIVGINSFDGNYEISLLDEMEGVTCLVDSSYAIQQKHELTNLKINDKIKIKGQCNGFLMGVKLDRCVLVK